MLQTLQLKNFKGWQSLDLDLAPITVLFGTNSAGKTGVLQSLLLLKQTSRAIDPRQHINFGGGDRDFADFGSYQDLVFAHKLDSKIEMGLRWNLPDELASFLLGDPESEEEEYRTNRSSSSSLNYEVCWKSNGDIQIEKLGYSYKVDGEDPHFIELRNVDEESYSVHVSESFRRQDDGDETNKSDEKSDREPATVGPPLSCYILPSDMRSRHFAKYAPFPPQFFSFAFDQLMTRVYYLGPLRQYPRRYYQRTGEMKSEVVEPDGADTIATLISSERNDSTLQNDVAQWLKDLDLVQAFRVIPTDRNKRFYEVTVTIEGQESALLDVGFGVSQVLPVVTMLLSIPMGSIAILEQPELHLHPNAQTQLADFLLSVAEQRQLQLLIESHSEHLLRRLQRRIAENELEFANPENIRTYFCKPTGEGSIVEEVEIDKYGQISNWPERFLGDINDELHSAVKAALHRRRTELARE